MNADLSVAPEIAQLAAPSGLPPRAATDAVPRTPGRVAGELARLAATPQRWWDLVRFDPDAPVRIPVPGTQGSWLLVLPPGASADCDCGYATLLAGEAAEAAVAAAGAVAAAAGTVAAAAGTEATAPLHPGRVRVHGRRAPHRVRGTGYGYSVTLHAPLLPAGTDQPAPAAALPPGE